ncbi:hypothetical protein Bbelb_231720 [Branchiostoma belcheri]|nr:hypothetical protein Bbelb_231720 [Branchiostoma belcheri]
MTATRAAIAARMGDGENSEDNSMHMSDDMEGSYEGNTDEGMDTSFSSESRYLDMTRPLHHMVDSPPIDVSLLYRSQPGPKPRVPQKFECALCPTRFTQRGNMLRHMRQKHWEDYQRTYVRAEPDVQHPPPPLSPPNRNICPPQGVKTEPQSPLIGQSSQYFISGPPGSGLPHHNNVPKLHFKKRHLAGGDHWDVNVFLREAVDSIPPPPPITSTDRTQYGYALGDYSNYNNATRSNESDLGWTPPVLDLPKGLHV